jgi:hypothetical protein
MDEHGKSVSFGVQVARAFDKFWDRNKLAVDSKGKPYRTNSPRVRPKGAGDFMDFRKPETKKKGKKSGEVY